MKRIQDFIRNYPRIILALIVILLGATIYLCFRNALLNSQLARYRPKLNSSWTVAHTHTNDKKSKQQEVRISSTDQSFSKLPEYAKKAAPDDILYWETDFSKKVDSGITMSTSPRLSADFLQSSSFEINYNPVQDSLVQLLFDIKSFETSFYNRVNGKYITRNYKLDLERYKYNWDPSVGLTYQNVSHISLVPYLYGRYQVFNKLSSIGMGISLKTRKLDYNLGLQLNHSKMFNPQINPDIELSITYKFDRKWLK